MSSKTLYTSQNEPIEWFERSPESFVDKTTLVFGGSGSGKTTIIEEILYHCKDHIPNYIVVAPRTSDSVYREKLPSICLRENLKKDELEKIWKRQFEITQVYNIANKISVLQSLFLKINNEKNIQIQNKILKYKELGVEKIKNNMEINFADKKTMENKLIKASEKKLIALYKNNIRSNKSILENKNLDNNEKIALKYLDLNPRIMLIIDDSTENFKQWMKYFKSGDSNVFESIFYKGRWNYITLVFAAHDDKVVKPELRKNARLTYYTTSQSLMASLSKAGSGFTAHEKKYAQRVADVIFNDDKIKTYKKLCYIREENQPFKYLIANLYDNFTLGSKALHDLAKKMPKKEDDLTNNSFVKSIINKNSQRNKKAPIKSNRRKYY